MRHSLSEWRLRVFLVSSIRMTRRAEKKSATSVLTSIVGSRVAPKFWCLVLLRRNDEAGQLNRSCRSAGPVGRGSAGCVGQFCSDLQHHAATEWKLAILADIGG